MCNALVHPVNGNRVLDQIVRADAEKLDLFGNQGR